jgi:two-component system sensor histidine kinase/response regulator
MPSRVKCLLVDDLEENLLALSALLRRDDVEILTARSGAEALELLLLHDVALAFLDVQMPDMDGFELAELMRGSERTSRVPIIFVTAGARDQHRLFKGYETGAVDFLYKPIDPYILRNKAEVFFQLHRQKEQLAQELEQRTDTLRLNEMFTAVLGHDLRNPLNAILIDDMLDLSRARLAGGISLKRVRTDLGTLVHRVVQEHQAAFPDRAVHLLVEGDLTGDWDADRLAQVASNLIGNSIQHGRANEPVHVRLDGTQLDIVVLSVANAGGIPAALLPHIFDPFRTGQRQSGRQDGLGLGLYIAKQIVQAHHGRVDVDSDSETRTEFRARLPRRVAEIVTL